MKRNVYQTWCIIIKCLSAKFKILNDTANTIIESTAHVHMYMSGIQLPDRAYMYIEQIVDR